MEVKIDISKFDQGRLTQFIAFLHMFGLEEEAKEGTKYLNEKFLKKEGKIIPINGSSYVKKV